MPEQQNIEESQSTLGDLVQTLELAPAEDRLFIGKKHGFPIGLKFITSEESILLLLQIRNPFGSVAAKQMRFEYDSGLQKLVSAGEIETAFEDKIVWLTIPNAGAMIESGQAHQVIESLLDTFEKAGLAGDADKCHYCRAAKVESLTCQNGKVAQICDECLLGRKKTQAAETELSAEGFTKIISIGILASLVGAVCWMLVWIGYDAIFDLLKTDEITLPRIVFAVPLVIVAALVGGPVGFLLRKIRNRGDRVAGYAGILFGTASIAVGEVLYVSWLIFKEYKVIAPSAALQVIPRLLVLSGPMYLAIKFMAAILSVTITYHLSRPQRAALKL